MVTTSATFAKYSNGGPVGIQPNQSIFVTDSTREGMFAARSSLVRMLNIIFSRNPISTDRPNAVAAITIETPIDQNLMWRRSDGVSHIEVVPPQTEWDLQVFTIQERDRLILDPQLLSNIMGGQSFRVLVNGLGNEDQPQWSVWTASLSNAPNGTTQSEVLSNPQIVYSLTQSYDFHVASFADRNLLLLETPAITVGQRVLVDGNSSTGGFWTVWEYVGPSSDPEVDADGFLLVRYQTYRTADFWNFTDWYASGYSASNPPIVSYASTKDRDSAENPPKSSIVIINDDGTGSWIWTAYINGIWTTVARQNGTIEFSSDFYTDTSRPTIGMEPISSSVLAKIPNRDGSWEFKVLFDALQDASLLEPVEVNELFFSMLHFVHAQQDQVPWAFKTSFMNIGGYNEQLTTTPVTPIDNSTNLIDYLAEVAPYRVKIRTFTQIVTPNLDNANVTATDFDFPLYYDPIQGKYRNLDINVESDLIIVANTAPWSDWYSTYLNPEFRPPNYNAPSWNGVRHFNIKMMFDRVDHMPIISTQNFTYYAEIPQPLLFSVDFTHTPITDLRYTIVEVYLNNVRLADSEFLVYLDTLQLLTTPHEGDNVTLVIRAALSTGLAADRIQQFYDPTSTEGPEKNLRTLMGLNQKGNLLDGGPLSNNAVNDYEVDGNYTGAESDESINPNLRPFGLADPEFEKDRPEELVAAGSGESISFFTYDANTGIVLSVISSARPGTDLLAPEEVGDYDAAPFDTIPLDIGHAQETSTDNASVQHGLYVIRRDSWQQTFWSNAGGILTFDLYANSNTISITTTANGTMPFTIPVVELVTDEQGTHQVTTAPGVVWINSERIEFFEFSVSNTTVTLSQIRRGTHNTRIGVEQRKVFKFSGNGTTTNFTLANTTQSYDIAVSVNQILHSYGGSVLNVDTYTGFKVNSYKLLNTDYLLNSSGNNVVVTFIVPPPSDSNNVIISVTTDLKHSQGTSVYDGAWQYYTPPELIPIPIANAIALGIANGALVDIGHP